MYKYLPLIFILGCSSPSTSEFQSYWDAYCKDRLQKTDKVIGSEFVEEYIANPADKKTIREECWPEFNIPTKVYKVNFSYGSMIFEKQNNKIIRHMPVNAYLEDRDDRRAGIEQEKQREIWRQEKIVSDKEEKTRAKTEAVKEAHGKVWTKEEIEKDSESTGSYANDYPGYKVLPRGFRYVGFKNKNGKEFILASNENCTLFWTPLPK